MKTIESLRSNSIILSLANRYVDLSSRPFSRRAYRVESEAGAILKEFSEFIGEKDEIAAEHILVSLAAKPEPKPARVPAPVRRKPAPALSLDGADPVMEWSPGRGERCVGYRVTRDNGVIEFMPRQMAVAA